MILRQPTIVPTAPGYVVHAAAKWGLDDRKRWYVTAACGVNYGGEVFVEMARPNCEFCLLALDREEREL